VNFGIKLLFLIHHTVSYNNLIVETVVECFITFISKLDKLSYILYFNLFLFVCCTSHCTILKVKF